MLGSAAWRERGGDGEEYQGDGGISTRLRLIGSCKGMWE